MFFVLYLISICLVSGVDVEFPSGRVCLGCQCFWCVGGDRLGLGARAIVLAWGYMRCVCLGFCFWGCGGFVTFLVRFVEFSIFLRFFILVLVRVFLYPRRCMIYYKVPDPRY